MFMVREVPARIDDTDALECFELSLNAEIDVGLLKSEHDRDPARGKLGGDNGRGESEYGEYPSSSLNEEDELEGLLDWLRLKSTAIGGHGSKSEESTCCETELAQVVYFVMLFRGKPDEADTIKSG